MTEDTRNKVSFEALYFFHIKNLVLLLLPMIIQVAATGGYISFIWFFFVGEWVLMFSGMKQNFMESLH